MDATEVISGLIWLVMIGLAGFVLFRLKTRRGHIGPAAAGTVYDIIHEDKRKAIEIVVADKAAARDFEHADDNDDDEDSGLRPS
ncbi:MAG: hypothetical protein A3J29_07855 [Acidobacteria bacterium RIFCSPLOWO2_12_FULL_67_14b]|nr:MAG: hypothetical protein A3J29_07855 [Acidobacteria bacterium RIFCSPLOWO2_12_FULL_67_14b]